MAFILLCAFLICLPLQKLCPSQVSMVMVLAVFIISLTTNGYVCGIIASLIGVLITNYVFTFPYFEFNFFIFENIVSAVVMLAVSVMTSMLTIKLKEQERLNAENDKEKMRANLLRAISHDLRTPLTTIYGSCSAIMENYDSLDRGRQLKLLGEIREDSECLIRMVENLLSVTKINGDNVHISKTPTVLEELIDAVLIKFHKIHPSCNVSVNIPDEFVSIPMDAVLIEQVLINLLENAVFHAKNMTVLKLTVYIIGGRAVFEVADNGCGIPKERMGNLFSGYLESADTPSDSNRNGMGIGLSVCSTIIKAHGGSITAENLKSGGAVFRFMLETEGADDEQQQV